MIVSHDEIATYTQLQAVSSSVASKSRSKTHSMNLEGTGPNGITTAMLSKHLATNAGWKLFGGLSYTSTNNVFSTCPQDIAMNHVKWLPSNATLVNIYTFGTLYKLNTVTYKPHRRQQNGQIIGEQRKSDSGHKKEQNP
jgi:hypothetical protein